MTRTELLLGCGSNRDKKLWASGHPSTWQNLTTVDFNPAHKPDVVHDLEKLPLPFDDNSFDEIAGYDVMEHLGRQGDWKFFFDQWADIWRMLKPNGVFCGISPHYTSPWAFGDPSHTRVITIESFTFLDQRQYEQVGITAMSDFRFYYKADMELMWQKVTPEKQLMYILRAVKPSRYQNGG